MIDIRSSSEDEMILEFLKMEYKSDRFRDGIVAALEQVGIGEEVLNQGDLSGENDNLLRRKLLGVHRGYPDGDVFENYPAEVSWKLVRMEAGDIAKLRYVDYSYWNELSGGTSNPVEGARTVLSGKCIFDVPNDGFYEGLTDLENGVTFPPLILLTADEAKYLILEGHKRATIYAMKPGSEAGAECLVGICSREALCRKDPKMSAVTE